LAEAVAAFGTLIARVSSPGPLRSGPSTRS